MRLEVFHLVVLFDRDPMALALDLAPVHLTGEVCDMHIRHVTPRREEVCLYCYLLLGSDDAPRSELLDHCLDCLVFVPNTVILQIFDILRIEGRDNGFNRHRIYHLLEGILLPFDLVVLLELEELAPLGVVLNFWVGELGIFEALAVEVVVSGGETYFGLGEHEREENVLFVPIHSCKVIIRVCINLEDIRIWIQH